MNKFIHLLFFSLLSLQLTAQPNNLSANELDSVARVFMGQQEYEGAIKYSKAACQKTEKLVGKKDSIYASMLNTLGVIYYDMYRDAEAGVIFEEVANIYKRTHGASHLKYAAAIESVGVISNSFKDFEKAEYLYKKIQPIYKKHYGELSQEYAFLLGNMAVLYDKWNRTELAESMYLQALDIEKKVIDVESTAHALSLNNFAIFLDKINKEKEAITLYHKALDIYAKKLGKQHSKYAHTLSNMGISYSNAKKFKQGEIFQLEALSIVESIYGKKSKRYLRLSNKLATTYSNAKKYPKAILLIQQNLALLEQEKASPLEFIAPLQTLTNLYSKSNDLPQVLHYGYRGIIANSKGKVDTSSLQSLLVSAGQHQFKNPHLALRTIEDIARTLYVKYIKTKNIGLLQKSYLCHKGLLNYMDQYKNKFAFDKDKFRVLKKMHSVLEGQIKNCLALHSIDSTKGYLTEVLQLMEKNKSTLLMETLQNQKNKTFGGLPDNIQQEEKALKKGFEILQKKLLTAVDSTEKSILIKKSTLLNNKIADFKKNIRDDFPKYHSLNYSSTNIKLKELQQLVDPQEVLLEYFIGKVKLYILVIKKNSIISKVVPYDSKKIKHLVSLFRNGLSNYSYIIDNQKKSFQQYSESAHALYQLLISPIESELKSTTHLSIIPDGLLGHIPFEVLLTSTSQKTTTIAEASYLLKKYSISYSYSAALLLENYNNQNATRKSNHELLAIAATYDERVDSNLLEQKYRSYKDFQLREQLNPIPQTAKEVQQLQARFKGKFLLGKEATETAFKQEAPHFGIIHLAMHGILDWNHPILSSMVFTENHDSLSDNFLFTSEISQMNINGDLVVLSACETGFGKFKQGEGILSLARSFMYAGTPSLVVSLWQVNDASTARIMGYFYDNLSQQMNKAEALQLAKLEYLKTTSGIAAHPAFWASFIQLGNKTPIVIETKSDTWAYTLGGIGVLSLLALGFFLKRK